MSNSDVDNILNLILNKPIEYIDSLQTEVLNKITSNGNTLVMYAIIQNIDVKKIQKLLEKINETDKASDLLMQKNINNDSALTLAAEKNLISIVELLLNNDKLSKNLSEFATEIKTALEKIEKNVGYENIKNLLCTKQNETSEKIIEAIRQINQMANTLGQIYNVTLKVSYHLDYWGHYVLSPYGVDKVAFATKIY